MVRLLVLLMVAGLALVGCGSPILQEEVPLPTFNGDSQPSFVPTPPPTSPPNEPRSTAPVALPTSVSVPAIDASSSLIQTGILPDDTIETPPVEKPDQASWYNLSPRPGARGPAIILGHVDGGGEKGIFYRLHELEVGSLVHIEREDGSTVSFEIYDVVQVAKNDFPTERVYGDTEGPEVRLITCGGAFGNAAPGHYDDNIIAFGRLRGD